MFIAYNFLLELAVKMANILVLLPEDGLLRVRNVEINDYNNYGDLLRLIPYNNVKVLREFERTQKKFINKYHSVMFNKTCILENLLPNIQILEYMIKQYRMNRSHQIIAWRW